MTKVDPAAWEAFGSTRAGRSHTYPTPTSYAGIPQNQRAPALAYLERWRKVQESVRAGELPPDTVKEFTRTLVDAAQADSVKSGKVDLTLEFQDLCQLPGVGDFFHELTSATPNREALRALGTPFHGWTRFEKEGLQARAGVTITHRSLWPESLGGVWEHEVARSITVFTRYAKWRDRRTRRLARVIVTAHDIVPA